MILFEKIKDSGLELFINYHPKVIDFKRKSKELYKKLKKEKALMQCQEIIAKENGFNNWHHFMTIIKKHYEKDLESDFLVTKNLDKYDDNLLLGHDINFNNYKWQSHSSQRIHQLILTNQYQEYNVFLMKQIISNNKTLMVLNPNKESIDKLIIEAIKNNREKDIRVLNFTNDNTYKKYECFLTKDMSVNIYSGMLTELFVSMYQSNNFEDKKDMISFISVLFMLLVYFKNNRDMILDFNTMREYSVFDKLFTVYKDDIDLPSHIKSALRFYFSQFPELINKENTPNEATLKKHEWNQTNLIKMIEVLESSNIFQEKGIEWDKIYSDDENNITLFYFGSEKKEYTETIQKLIISIIKNNVTKKLGKMLYVDNTQERESIKNKYLFLIDCYVTMGVAVMPSQARVTGLCMNFSYSSMKELKNKSNNEMKEIIDNTGTKIISNENKAVLLEMTPLINIKMEEEILVDNSIKTNNALWIVRKEEYHQIEFDLQV